MIFKNRNLSLANIHDLVSLRKSSEPVAEYLAASSREAAAFSTNAEKYELDRDITERLKDYVEGVVVFTFSAEWCPDCHRHIPVLGLIAEATGLEVKVFGHLMRDPKRPKGYWAIPPSPAEVEEFNVRKIPTIVILDTEGNKIGEIIENPPEGKSLEEALLGILEEN